MAGLEQELIAFQHAVRDARVVDWNVGGSHTC